MTNEISKAEIEQLIQRVSQIPISKTLDFSLVSAGGGEVEAKMPRNKVYDGIYESVHGGIMMTFADSIAAFALLTLTGARERMTTTDMNIRFLAPCLTTVTAKAKVIKLGRSLCPVVVDLYDDRGIHVAIAQVSYMRLPAGV